MRPRIYRGVSGMWIVSYQLDSAQWLAPFRTWLDALGHVRKLYEVSR
jgi:hypothetical protein